MRMLADKFPGHLCGLRLAHRVHALVDAAQLGGVDRHRAAGNEHVGMRVLAQGLPHGLAGLLLGIAGHRASVHDHDIGLPGLGQAGALVQQRRGDPVDLHAVDLAADVHQPDSHARPPNPLISRAGATTPAVSTRSTAGPNVTVSTCSLARDSWDIS